MKLVLLAVAALCVGAHSAVFDNNAVSETEAHFGHQQFNVKVSPPNNDVTDQDMLLSYELAELERIQSRSLVADLITNLLESARQIVINGDPEHGIPPLDPLIIPQIGPIVHTGLGTRLTAELRNIRAEGLAWYVVDNISFNALRLTLGGKVILPWLTVTGSYDANAIITLLTHNAGGDFRVFVNRLEVSVDTRLGTNIFGGGHLLLRELDINIRVHDVSVRIEGMVGSSILNNLINNAVQSIAQNALADQMEALGQLLSTELFDIINDILSNFTLEDLLG